MAGFEGTHQRLLVKQGNFTGWVISNGPPTQFPSFITFFLRFLKIFIFQYVEPNKTKLFSILLEFSVVKLMYQRFILDLKLNNSICSAVLYSFPLFKRDSSKLYVFAFSLIKKCKIYHLLPKLCKINPNFKLISSNEITVGSNHKFPTLTQNGLKAIAANQRNHVK